MLIIINFRCAPIARERSCDFQRDQSNDPIKCTDLAAWPERCHNCFKMPSSSICNNCSRNIPRGLYILCENLIFSCNFTSKLLFEHLWRIFFFQTLYLLFFTSLLKKSMLKCTKYIWNGFDSQIEIEVCVSGPVH